MDSIPRPIYAIFFVFFVFALSSCDTDLGYEVYCDAIAECGQNGVPRAVRNNLVNVCFCDCDEGYYGKYCQYQKSECQGNLVLFLEPYEVEDGPCICRCVSLGPVHFKPPECTSIDIRLENTDTPAKRNRDDSSDYFPLNEYNSWFFNTLDSLGEVEGEFGFEAKDFYTRSDTIFKPTTVYIPDSLGTGLDTFPGQQYFEISTIENDIYTIDNASSNSLFLYHHFTPGDTLVIDEDTSYIYDMGTISVPAGDFDNCIGVISPDSSGMILAPETGMIAFMADSMIVAELKEFSLFCSYGVSITVENESCPGANDGRFNLAINGDTTGMNLAGDLTFEWTGPTEIPAGADPINLTSGYYFVTISNANCEAVVDSLMIMSPDPIEIMVDNKSDVSCIGDADGSIEVSFFGGTGPLTFSWNDGAYTTEDLFDLPSGNYSLEVVDSLGCSHVVSIDIDEPDALLSVPIVQDISCHGFSDGSITPVISGGSAGYQYNWSDGSTNMTLQNLESGIYDLIVTDTNNCTAEFSYFVSEPDSLITSHDQLDVSCNGFSDGSVYVSVSGGSSPYQFLWNTGETNDTITSLMAGMYFYTVTDGNGCTAEGSSLLNQPEPISVLIDSLSDASCHQSSDGYASLSISGGEAPFDIHWNNGDTGFSNADLVAGEYMATITDFNGCEEYYTISISEPENLFIQTQTVQHVTCYGDQDGFAELEMGGGTPGYSYLWDNGQTEAINTDLGPGTHVVTITDANGCTFENETLIEEPDSLILILTSTDANASMEDGTATAMVSGGTEPYSYLWDDDDLQTTEQANNLSPGMYTAFITDANGCTVEASIEVKMSTSIEVINQNQKLRLFPVPAFNYLKIELTDFPGALIKVEIYNTQGIKVIEEQINYLSSREINVSDLKQGAYLLIINIEDGRFARKFIKL